MAESTAIPNSVNFRPVWAEIDLDAILRNAEQLAVRAKPAELLAVVKADGYGHGAVEVARAALAGGATWLGVALVEEGIALRSAGVDAPLLMMSEPPVDAAATVVRERITPVVYTRLGIEALSKAATEAGLTKPFPVHLKVDTGMHRVGCAPADATDLARYIASQDSLDLEGLMTHLAVADEPDHPATDEQLACFDDARAKLVSAGFDPPIVHAANSAALLGNRPRYDLVRCGIALYGIPPAEGLSGGLVLRPAMSLKVRAAFVKEMDAGERISYGLRYPLRGRGRVATLPVGYADGVPRRLGEVGGEVLARGRRRAIAGTITMDQLMVDHCDDVEAGEEFVLIGTQGSEEISAMEWAFRLGTIAYEVVCGISSRVPRRYIGVGAR